MLSLSDLEVRFGGVRALRALSLEVGEGEIVSLIGPNGAGKSTAFNVISRITTPVAGSISFAGRDLLRTPAHGITGLGIGRTYQGLELFASMSVSETLEAGYLGVEQCGLFAAAVRSRSCARVSAGAKDAARSAARLLDLEAFLDVSVASLPYGIQKRVDIARALVGRPRLLLLDEPAAGLTHGDLEDLAELIATIRRDLGTAILLVEHHMSLVMSISDRIYVLDSGERIAVGSPAEIRENPRVIEAYLGNSQEV